MELTPEQQQALLSLLDEKYVTLADLNLVKTIGGADLLLIRQGVEEKAVTIEQFKTALATPASTTQAGITLLSNAINSASDSVAATSKAVKTVADKLQYHVDKRHPVILEDSLTVKNHISAQNGLAIHSNYWINKTGSARGIEEQQKLTYGLKLQGEDFSNYIDEFMTEQLDDNNDVTNVVYTVDVHSDLNEATYQFDAKGNVFIPATLYVGYSSRNTNTKFDIDGDLYGPLWQGSLAAHLLATQLPVGIPQPWSHATAPNGWLICNGAKFDTTKYPLLTKAYPNGSLPDLRGEFIRGWDNGRGVENQRQLLSAQAASVVCIGDPTSYGPCVVNLINAVDNDSNILRNALHGEPVQSINTEHVKIIVTPGKYDPGSLLNTLMSVRPRNIAFNYIVRAA